MSYQSSNFRLNAALHPVLMAGSANLDHWPLSRITAPLQFQREPDGYSPFQSALLALLKNLECAITAIVPSSCLETARDQADEIGAVGQIRFLVEPMQRGTLPGVLLAAILESREEAPANLMILDSLHPPRKHEDFGRFVAGLVQSPLPQGHLVVTGSSKMGSGFGPSHIACGQKLGNQFLFETNGLSGREESLGVLPQGPYISDPQTFLELASIDFGSQIWTCNSSLASLRQEGNTTWLPVNLWSSLQEADLLDLIMKDDRRILARPVEFHSHNNRLPSNLNANHYLSTPSSNCEIVGNGPLIAVAGLDDVTIRTSPDAILIVKHGHEQEASRLVDQMKAEGRREIEFAAKSETIWGKQDLLEEANSHLVAKLTLSPGACLPVHFHSHRSEFWLVLSGNGRMVLDGKNIECEAGTSLNIPRHALHSLQNTSDRPLEVIEVRRGDILTDIDHTEIVTDQPVQLAIAQ